MIIKNYLSLNMNEKNMIAYQKTFILYFIELPIYFSYNIRNDTQFNFALIPLANFSVKRQQIHKINDEHASCNPAQSAQQK